MTDIATTAKSLFSNFIGFLNHYSTELDGVATALNTVVNAVPIDSQDKANVTGIVDKLKNAVDDLRSSVASMPEPTLGDVVVNKSDLEAVVREVLPSILQELGIVNPNPTGGNSPNA